MTGRSKKKRSGLPCPQRSVVRRAGWFRVTATCRPHVNSIVPRFSVSVLPSVWVVQTYLYGAAQVSTMDAGVIDPTGHATGYTGRSIEERVSALEGMIANQNRIFDMLHEGQQNLRADIAELRTETNMRITEMREDMDKRFGEMSERIAEMDVRLNAKIDSTFKWLLGVQIAMWVTIIAAVLL